MHRLIATLVTLAALTAPAAAIYPERNITIICASDAGGIVDVTTRIVAEHMAKTLGRTVLVQNEPGAGSTLAISALTKAAPDVPPCRIEHVETPNPLNPLGVKGAGEGGTIPAPAAIISAIEDALSPFGVRFAEMPLTPDRIVDALRKAGAYEVEKELTCID